MVIKLVYQPYGQNMAIFIEDQPISTISRLSRYQSQPFSSWCSEILSALAEEVNDNYELIYIGQTCEYEVLKQFMFTCPACHDIVYQAPEIPDSTLVRLKKLSRIAQYGISIERQNVSLSVYTDLDIEVVKDSVQMAIPKLSFCRFSLSYHSISDVASEQNPRQAIAVLGSQSCTTEAASRNAIGVVSAVEDRPYVLNDALILPMRNASVSECIGKILELCVYPAILTSALSKCNVADNSPYFSDIFMLDKVEAQTVVKLPKSIELGDEVQIQVTTIPKGAKQPRISCKVSNDAVIEYRDGYLKAVGTGEAVVEVREAGKTVVLCTNTITAYRRNRIQSLSVQPVEIKMCVGEYANMSYSFTPMDADNESSVHLVSKDGTIASAQGHLSVFARSPGRCSIQYEAEKVRSNPCNVIVYPRLEKLSMSLTDTCVKVNSMTKVNVQRYPNEATLDKLSFSVEPSYLGTFDVGSGSFFARQVGSGRIIVKSDRNDVQASVPIEVMSGGFAGSKALLIAAVGVLLIGLLWFFLR